MNVIDEDKMRDALLAVVDRATNDLRTQTIEPAIAQVNGLVDRAAGEFGNVARGIVEGAQAVVDEAVAKLQTTIAGLDGWTATITIPPITIRLTGPEKRQ